MDVTLCLTQSTTANFTCEVDGGSSQITSAHWQILSGGDFISVVGRPRHMSNASLIGNILTDILTVTDVSVSDNGTQYRCQPTSTVNSTIATLTVLGEIMVYLSVCMCIHIINL